MVIILTIDFVTSKILYVRSKRRIKGGNIKYGFFNVPFRRISVFCKIN